MSDFGLIKGRTADGAIPQNRIVKHGSADGNVALATTATDSFDGVSGIRGADAQGDRIDIYKDGIRPLEYGGTVAAGDPLTSDATGRAIKAAPVAGTNVRCIGFAEVSGVVGDIGDAHIVPFIMQG
ncbi:DUF2190 family protein [Terasakiella sp. A23]|uniref:capsid cement protein n=1 Tax=Terasakiella sp. FCG-A23 TaxID=3080561 RepID=UPI0029545725|nr:capsid cement protein [Terasakiella sp. A23]MDV7340979.1 DUF2190 family protein [Terasakiella sp. A23]